MDKVRTALELKIPSVSVRNHVIWTEDTLVLTRSSSFVFWFWISVQKVSLPRHAANISQSDILKSPCGDSLKAFKNQHIDIFPARMPQRSLVFCEGEGVL